MMKKGEGMDNWRSYEGLMKVVMGKGWAKGME